MKLKDYFAADRVVFPKVPNGETQTVSEFFEKCLNKIWLLPETIVKWHRMLTSYSEPNKNNRLLVRLHESVPVHGVCETRRGAITRMADGFEYAFASNFFARVIYSMAYRNYVPDEKDFADMINNRKVCISYPLHVNPGEQEISAYPSRIGNAEYSTKGLYTPDWYLAHIADVNHIKKVPYRGFEGVRPCDVMPSGIMTDWKIKGGMVVRELNEEFKGKKALVRANFLRFLDPINYFLVPARKLEQHEIGGSRLGEVQAIVAYAKQKMISDVKRIDPGIYADFCDKALIPEDYIDVKDMMRLGGVKMHICFASKLIGKIVPPHKKKKVAKGGDGKYHGGLKMRVGDTMLREIVRAYLEKGKSYRTIEHEILGLDFKRRGGGFVVQTILKGLGISTAEKGVLAHVSPQEFIENCSDPLRSILIKIYGVQ